MLVGPRYFDVRNEMIVGFPPFYTGNSNNNKMYVRAELIKSKPVFFPDAKKHGIESIRIAMSDIK